MSLTYGKIDDSLDDLNILSILKLWKKKTDDFLRWSWQSFLQISWMGCSQGHQMFGLRESKQQKNQYSGKVFGISVSSSYPSVSISGPMFRCITRKKNGKLCERTARIPQTGCCQKCSPHCSVGLTYESQAIGYPVMGLFHNVTTMIQSQQR